LKRQRAFSDSPFEKRISPSLNREASSGWGWAKERLCKKIKKRKARMNFHPLSLRVVDGGNIINFRQVAIIFIKVNPVAYDKDVLYLRSKIICLISTSRRAFLSKGHKS
jgi:hypothetical protein